MNDHVVRIMLNNSNDSCNESWCCSSSNSSTPTSSDRYFPFSAADHGRFVRSSLAVVFTMIPVTLIIIVIASGNGLVIVAVLRDKRLKNQLQNWLIVSLSVADLLVGLLIMPVTLSYELLDYWPLGEVMCEIWLASDVLFVTASILNLCAISLDRFWSLTSPVYYATRRTAKRTLLMIVCVWVASILVCGPLIVGWRPTTPSVPNQCLLSRDLGYVLYSSCGSFFIPVFILIFVYAKIYRITRRRAKRNLRETRTRQEMLQTIDTEPASAIAACPTPKLSNSMGRKFLKNEFPISYDPNGVSSVSGTIKRALLTVTLDIVAVSVTSMEELPSVLSSAEPDHFWREKSIDRIAQENGRLKPPCLLQLPSSRFERAGSLRKGACADSGLGRGDSSLSLNASSLHEHIGHRRKVMRRRERQATSLLGLIVLAFVLCWMPFFCIYVLRAVCCQPPDALFDVIFWLGYCNSALNPFIYNFFNPEFRQAFMRILYLKGA